MNKSQFLADLNYHLQAIPEKERHELIEDYVAHFEFGLQEGKSEEELARELGSPQEIAIEAIAEYERTQTHVNNNTAYTKTSTNITSSSKTPRTIFSIIGLFFLNFVCAVIPLLLSIWVTWACIILAFMIAIVSPLVAVVDFVANSYFTSSMLFLGLIMSGVSIFAVLGLIPVGKWLKSLTIAYFKWNLKIIKGAE